MTYAHRVWWSTIARRELQIRALKQIPSATILYRTAKIHDGRLTCPGQGGHDPDPSTACRSKGPLSQFSVSFVQDLSNAVVLGTMLMMDEQPPLEPLESN